MSIRIKTQIKESFIHLEKAKIFLNIANIEQVEYFRTDGLITEIEVSFPETVVPVTDKQDIRTLAAYFDLLVLLEPQENQEPVLTD